MFVVVVVVVVDDVLLLFFLKKKVVDHNSLDVDVALADMFNDLL